MSEVGRLWKYRSWSRGIASRNRTRRPTSSRRPSRASVRGDAELDQPSAPRPGEERGDGQQPLLGEAEVAADVDAAPEPAGPRRRRRPPPGPTRPRGPGKPASPAPRSRPSKVRPDRALGCRQRRGQFRTERLPRRRAVRCRPADLHPPAARSRPDQDGPSHEQLLLRRRRAPAVRPEPTRTARGSSSGRSRASAAGRSRVPAGPRSRAGARRRRRASRRAGPPRPAGPGAPSRGRRPPHRSGPLRLAPVPRRSSRAASGRRNSSDPAHSRHASAGTRWAWT